MFDDLNDHDCDDLDETDPRFPEHDTPGLFATPDALLLAGGWCLAAIAVGLVGGWLIVHALTRWAAFG